MCAELVKSLFELPMWSWSAALAPPWSLKRSASSPCPIPESIEAEEPRPQDSGPSHQEAGIDGLRCDESGVRSQSRMRGGRTEDLRALSSRHVPRSIAMKCSSSSAKWSTALLRTTSAKPSGNDVSSIVSTRKFRQRPRKQDAARGSRNSGPILQSHSKDLISLLRRK